MIFRLVTRLPRGNVRQFCRGIMDSQHHGSSANFLKLPEMNRIDFELIANALEKPYMSEVTGEWQYPVKGMIYNLDVGRRCVCLPVQRQDKTVWVPFVINSGSPKTLLSEDALRALGVNIADTDNLINVSIGGFHTLSAHHEPDDQGLRNINVLGWSFFKNTKVYEQMNAEDCTLTLHKDYAHFLSALKAQPGPVVGEKEDAKQAEDSSPLVAFLVCYFCFLIYFAD